MSLITVVPIENLQLAVVVNNTDYIPISQNGVTKKVTFSTLSSAVTLPALPTGKIYIGDNSNLPAAQTVSGDASISQLGALTISANAVSNAKFRQSAALSVVGNATNGTANVADITAGTDGMVLARNGTALEFRLLLNANIGAGAAIAYSKLSLTNSIVNADVSSSAAIAYSKLNLGNSIVNADVNASAAIALTKLGITSFTKTVGSIASGQTINASLQAAVSSNGDSFANDMSIGTNDNNTINILQNASPVFKALQNSGGYTPKFVMIGDRAVSNVDLNICMVLGSTSQQTTTGVGKGLAVKNRLTVSAADPVLYDLYQDSEIYNPAAYSLTGARLVGLRLGYDSGTAMDWQLCYTRLTGWIASDGGDIPSPFGFTATNATAIGGDGATAVNYLLGDPKYFVRHTVQETGGTFVDVYIPAYAANQIPNTP